MIPSSYRDEPLTGWEIVRDGWWYLWRGLAGLVILYGFACLFLL